MEPYDKTAVLKEFRQMPGVGKSIANDLWMMGFRSIPELKGKHPEVLYDDFCKLVGQKVDICMLYVFRCVVYYASEKQHEPDKLNWWYWKNKQYPE